jgi:stress response protein SCP2
VRSPMIEIRGIQVREGGRASVEVRTRAAGQRAVSEVLQLRRENGEWRVEALGG